MNFILILSLIIFIYLQFIKFSKKKDNEGFASVLNELNGKFFNSTKIRMKNILKINPAGLGYSKDVYHDNWKIHRNKQSNINLQPDPGPEINLVEGINFNSSTGNGGSALYMIPIKTPNDGIGYKEYNGDNIWNFSHWMSEEDAKKLIVLAPNKKYIWIGWARTLGSIENKEPHYNLAFYNGQYTVNALTSKRIPNDKLWRLYVFKIETVTETTRPNLTQPLISSPTGEVAKGEILIGSESKPQRAKIEWGSTFVVPGELEEYLADCYEHSQCDEDNGEQCKLGTCTVKEGYCKNKEDCGKEEKCIIDECKPKEWCSIDLNCLDGEQCKESKCVKKTAIEGVDDNTLFGGIGAVALISICSCCCLLLLVVIMMMSSKKNDDVEEDYEE